MSPWPRRTEKIQNLRGIVLASDGDWNEGKPPVETAARLRMKNVPVFTVAVGSPSRLPDVELLSLDAPTFGVAGKSVRIPFTIDSSLPREYATTVILRGSDGDELSREVRIAPMTRTTDAIVWKPKATGDFTLSLEVPKHAEETLTDNNRLTAPIAIREEKLRVLVVESYPRWEYRYLRNALSRDPGVDVSCLLFHPGLSKVGGGNKDYIKQFPTGLDELSKYRRCVFGRRRPGRWPVDRRAVPAAQGTGGAPGERPGFHAGNAGAGAIAARHRARRSVPGCARQRPAWGLGLATPNHFELTETGRCSLLTKLADTQDDNAEVWEGLPGFQWYAPVLRAKAGSEVLAVHKDAANEFGRLPLLATRTFGAGKVLFMGTDGAWRWRKGVEDKYHYRFWGQVVRWMAYQRNMAKGETMRLYYVPDQPKMNQTISLHANVMDKGGEPLHGGEVSALIKAPSGKSDRVRFSSTGDEWGVFAGKYTAMEPGKHERPCRASRPGRPSRRPSSCRGRRPNASADLRGRKFSKRSPGDARQGRSRPTSSTKSCRSLAELPEPPPSIRRLQLWSHPALAAGIVVLLGVFWVGRKVIGLV